MDSEPLSDNCGEPSCLVCLHGNSLVATYDELPGWMFTLTEVAGGCEALAFDGERRRRLQATGISANGMLRDLQEKAVEIGPDRQSYAGH